MTIAERVASMDATIDSMLATLAAAEASQAAGNWQPDASLDGESYQWEAWRSGLLKRINDAIDLRNKIANLAPWKITTRGRT